MAIGLERVAEGGDGQKGQGASAFAEPVEHESQEQEDPDLEGGSH